MAINTLDQIDREFEGSCQQRQLFYEKLAQGFGRGSETYDTVLHTLETLRNNSQIDDIFIVSSQSQLLVVQHARQRNGYRWLVSRPLPERQEIFARLLTSPTFKFTYDEALCLIGKADNDEITSRITHKHTEKLKKLLPKVARECIDYSNEIEGIKTLKSSVNSDLLVSEMAGSDAETSFRFLKLSQGKLIPVPRAIGEGFLYVVTLKDTRREAQYVVFLFHDYASLHRDYLLQACANASRPDTGILVRAYNFEDPVCIAYPIMAHDPYEVVRDMLNRARRDSLYLHVGEGTEERLITARVPKQLSDISLVHVLPATVIEQQLSPYRLRVFGCMAGVTLICLTLGWILMQRFLVPVYQLAEGVKAISNRDFSHRVVIQSRDELGLLGHTLNRTIAYLSEMEMALTIQRTLFPTGNLTVGTVEISGRNEMTQAVGGDYFDYFTLAGDRAVVLLGDVSGHGVSAALVTAMAKAGFHLLFERYPADPRQVFEQMNLQMYEILRRKKMMTCLCGLIDLKNQTMQMLNAGQSFPVMVADNGSPQLCELVSNPLGVLKKGKFAESTIPLTGIGIVLYSDGLIEALNADGQMFTYDRFQQAAATALNQLQATPAQTIFQTVRQFTGSIPWNDDATVVIIRPIKPHP